MPSKRYLSAKEAAEMLNISISTLYAYVSRGLIRSEQSAEGKRQRRYYAEDVEKLLARKEGRRNPEKLAKDALHWGTPVLDSAITLIDKDKLYYRGHDVEILARERSLEDVASLIWTQDINRAEELFSSEISAQKYETMLVHMEIDGAELNQIQELQTFLPSAGADDLTAYDLRPKSVATTGARIIRLMASVVAGEVPEDISISAMLQQGWCAKDEKAIDLINAALIVVADHELNASSFSARVVASAGSTPYACVLAGLSALQGVKHGGYTERVEALLDEVSSSNKVRDVLGGRLRRGETIPGFGHALYAHNDPRARVLLALLEEHYGDSEQWQMAQAVINTVDDLIGQFPTIDTALVVLSRVLNLPQGSSLALFALGRTVGWIGHAIEQYETDRLIRPRARYTGEHPE